MEKDKPRVAVNILVVRDGKILLGKRKGSTGGGYFGLPGGKLEFYESLEDCAKRELEEETGLRCDNISFLHVINDPRPNDDKTHWIHFEFIAKDPVGQPKLMEPDKCAGWEWFDMNNLPDDIFIGFKQSIPTYLRSIVALDAGKELKMQKI